MKKKKKKKLFFIFISVFILIIAFLINIRIKTLERKDIVKAAEQYVTTGFFNKEKLYEVNYYHLTFSDTNYAIIDVKGMQCKVPHRTCTYKLTMSKDNYGLWSVTKFEDITDTNTYYNEDFTSN